MLLDPKYRIVSVTREQYLAALRLYIARPDKQHSMVDCISMTVMRDEGTYEALATDREFTQEGFVNVWGGGVRGSCYLSRSNSLRVCAAVNSRMAAIRRHICAK